MSDEYDDGCPCNTCAMTKLECEYRYVDEPRDDLGCGYFSWYYENQSRERDAREEEWYEKHGYPEDEEEDDEWN